MKEYGSSIQKLADYLVAVEDREKRTRHAHLLVELMRQIHPNMKDNQDYSNKLWDDLYIMTDFKLEVDSPFPPPPIEAVGKKPKPVPYNTHNLRYKHYGRNLELMIEKACKTENDEDRTAFVAYIARMMKVFYGNWSRGDAGDDNLIYEQILELSKGKLVPEIANIKAGNVVDAAPKDRYNANYVSRPHNSGQPRRFDNNNSSNGNSNRNNNNKNRNNSSNNNHRNRKRNGK